jgi:hypothetical protein
LLLGFFLSGASSPATEGIVLPSSLPEVVISESGAYSSSRKPKIGDRITFQADLKSGPGLSGQIITLKPRDQGTELEGLGWYLVQGTLNQNGLVRFIASPLKAGDLILPPLVIVGSEGKEIAITSPFSLSVEGPVANPDEKPQLIEVVALSLPLRYWIYLGVVLMGLGFLSRKLYLLYKRNRKPSAPLSAPPPPPEPDHILALRKIDELYIRHPFSAENLKVVSFGVSEIIKEFFSKRFKIDALESTTDEMIMLLRREALSGDQLRAIQLLFQELDQFKFTKTEDYPPVYEETHANLKVKATLIIQKWALATKEDGVIPS